MISWWSPIRGLSGFQPQLARCCLWSWQSSRVSFTQRSVAGETWRLLSWGAAVLAEAPAAKSQGETLDGGVGPGSAPKCCLSSVETVFVAKQPLLAFAQPSQNSKLLQGVCSTRKATLGGRIVIFWGRFSPPHRPPGAQNLNSPPCSLLYLSVRRIVPFPYPSQPPSRCAGLQPPQFPGSCWCRALRTRPGDRVSDRLSLE